jgi:NAD(P)-dependent dehydrogenase (short-subunit alcohol dehydrogenase family)
MASWPVVSELTSRRLTSMPDTDSAPPHYGTEGGWPRHDRVVLITGASRGIGAAVAQAFITTDARLVLTARDEAALAALQRELDPTGERVVAAAADVTRAGEVHDVVNLAVDRFGRLDCAVNAAADHGRRPAPLADHDLDQFDRTIATSLRGLFVCLQAEISAMLATTTGGAIVNVASTAAAEGVAGLADYVAAKHGVLGLTRTAALDYARQGIRVNSILPGPIRTERLSQAPPETLDRVAGTVPIGRLGLPSEVAAATLWLCSAAAAFVTGAELVVDGGGLAGSHAFDRRPPEQNLQRLVRNPLNQA